MSKKCGYPIGWKTMVQTLSWSCGEEIAKEMTTLKNRKYQHPPSAEKNKKRITPSLCLRKKGKTLPWTKTKKQKYPKKPKQDRTEGAGTLLMTSCPPPSLMMQILTQGSRTSHIGPSTR